MSELEFKTERDAIEVAYSEKIMPLRNQLRDIATRDADLTMQRAQNEQERCRIEAMLDQVIYQRDQELLKLEREYMTKKE